MKRVLVVGAGIIGLACAWRLQKSGARVTVVDTEPEGDKCSFGNAGGIAVTEVVPASVPGLIWKVPRLILDPLGPLSIRWQHALPLIPWMSAFVKAANPKAVRRAAEALASLNRLVYADLIPMMSDIGLEGDLHRGGAIVLYSSKKAFDNDLSAWRLRTELGIEWRMLPGEELAKMEPDLAPDIQTGVFLPAWSHVAHPRRIVDRLREKLISRGATIRALTILDFEFKHGAATSAVAQNGERLSADAFVIAAGAWSAVLAARLGDRVLLESERGYNTTIAAPSMKVRHELIFAESNFVVTPLEEGLRIGGAAEFAGLRSRPNFQRSRALRTLAKRALPALPMDGGTLWMGNRPATPDSLPVIGTSTRAINAYFAFGHGHLGLTQAAPTGRLIDELVRGGTPSADLDPFSPRRFASGA
jgi:D-amino-acid dehydrogenase